jgi:hypothetical protein
MGAARKMKGLQFVAISSVAMLAVLSESHKVFRVMISRISARREESAYTG